MPTGTSKPLPPAKRSRPFAPATRCANLPRPLGSVPTRPSASPTRSQPLAHHALNPSNRPSIPLPSPSFWAHLDMPAQPAHYIPSMATCAQTPRDAKSLERTTGKPHGRSSKPFRTPKWWRKGNETGHRGGQGMGQEERIWMKAQQATTATGMNTQD